ncbi:MAG: hypothetical protein KI785_14730 [Devosiaceae bacterium]|nr:hypothetical protein [Devosiaceae bacterium MH13]
MASEDGSGGAGGDEKGADKDVDTRSLSEIKASMKKDQATLVQRREKHFDTLTAIDEVLLTGGSGASDQNKVRGLAHFQNAALVFAAAILSASFIALSNSASGTGDTPLLVAGLSVGAALKHVIAWLIAGAIIVTLAAAVTQLFYGTLKGPGSGAKVSRIFLALLTAIGAALMAYASAPFLAELFGQTCAAEPLAYACADWGRSIPGSVLSGSTTTP